MHNIHERTEILFEESDMKKINNAKVMIAGVGGVGGYIAESLARAGVGTIMIFDNDKVTYSNINRQIVALQSTVGLSKVDVLKSRIMDINPDCNIIAYNTYLDKDNISSYLNICKNYDYIIDAIDSLSCKVNLVKTALEMGFNIISSMGAGGKINPLKIKVADILKTTDCPLAKAVRINLKRQRVKKGILAVFSTEKAKKALPPVEVKNQGRARAVNGTVSYMPGLFGLTISGIVINKIINNEKNALI